jgi:hypothetical protein
MIQVRRRLKTTMMIISSAACLALVVLFPGWREELRAQVYTLFGPSITIDICEVDNAGVVRVGGRLGEDSRIGEPVFVSRGNQNQSVGVVMGNGTFEGATSPGFGAPGQIVTVGVRVTGGQGTLMSTCQLGSGVGGRR